MSCSTHAGPRPLLFVADTSVPYLSALCTAGSTLVPLLSAAPPQVPAAPGRPSRQEPRGRCSRGKASAAAKRWRRGTATAGRAGPGLRGRSAHGGSASRLCAQTRGKAGALGKGRAVLCGCQGCTAWSAQRLGARLAVPGVMEQLVLCFSTHPKHLWALPARVCGAGCWGSDQESAYCPMLPGGFLTLAGRAQEWRLGTAERVLCRLMATGQGCPLPVSSPASETGDVCVLNCPLLISHGWECPKQLPLCGGLPAPPAPPRGRQGLSPAKAPTHPLGLHQPGWCCSLMEQTSQLLFKQLSALPGRTATFMEMYILFKVKPGSVCTSEENLSQSMKRILC